MPFLCLLVRVHGHNLTPELSPSCLNLGEPLAELLSESLGVLLGDLGQFLGTFLLRIVEHTTGLGQHALHRRLQQGPHLTPQRCERFLGGQHHNQMTALESGKKMRVVHCARRDGKATVASTTKKKKKRRGKK